MGLWATLKAEIKTTRNLLRNRIYISPKTQEEIIREFHKVYYDSNIFGKTFVNTYWMGTPILKCPLDMWIYQEILHELKPDLIIECGTADGGSAMFYASMFDLIGHGEIVSVDIVPNENRPKHQRVTYILGSSTAPEIVAKVKEYAKGKSKILIILDSDHSKKHVLDELRAYHSLVTLGSYLVVEDSNVNGHPVFPEHGEGPMEALQEFLKENNDFMIDKSKEKFYLTFNPSGYLKKIK